MRTSEQGTPTKLLRDKINTCFGGTVQLALPLMEELPGCNHANIVFILVLHNEVG